MPKIRVILLFSVFMAVAQPASPPNRIVRRIAGGQRIPLRGNLHPKALPENDQGSVDPAYQLPRVTLNLQPSASQQAALTQLLAEQQDPASPNFHHWLTPEEFADRFGVSQSDVDQIVGWLQSQNFTVTGVARGRDWVAVSGPASAVEAAFGTPIHHYLVNGKVHFANAAEPSIPAALQGIVVAIHGLNDFRLKPASRPRGIVPQTAQPQYNNTTLCGGHCLAPDDVATIYNIAPLFGSGLNGSGQKVVIAGQTQIRLTDIQQFRSTFNLPANDPQVLLVAGATDPGIVSGDLTEADLDLELAGSVARNATLLYVYSSDVMTSVQYAIDQNLAPVLSTSYGDCEAAYAPAEALQMQALAQKANALGITWFGASGDSGATDCAGDTFPGATSTASVDLPAGLPEVTGIGGSEFSDANGNYWNATNTTNNASALSYIPEMAWNDSVADGTPSASGGGHSMVFAKPAWQVGTGVPDDQARDVPDISISASANHDGYAVFSSDPSTCRSGPRGTTLCEAVFGGTSVGAPLFAGLAALLNQSVVSSGLQSSAGLGNINPKLYSLAQTAPAAFHDITTGDNIITVVCTTRQRNCTPGPVGYHAGAGYDPVTGLGSVDAHALFTAWVAGGSGRTTSPVGGPAPAITAIGNGASYRSVFAPGMILTVFGSQLAPSIQTAGATPLPPQLAGVTVSINGISAPLWYVSPGQINIQIPYETPVNTSVVLTVNNNGQSASTSFVAAAAAPGIFTDQQGAPVPFASATRGQVITMYVTGVGAVSPAIADAAAPAAGTPVGNLPAPTQTTSVTVGGIDAPIQFVGIPWGLAGITQINYQIPSGAPLGAQPVVVRVGGTPSAPATLTVTAGN